MHAFMTFADRTRALARQAAGERGAPRYDFALPAQLPEEPTAVSTALPPRPDPLAGDLVALFRWYKVWHKTQGYRVKCWTHESILVMGIAWFIHYQRMPKARELHAGRYMPAESLVRVVYGTLLEYHRAIAEALAEKGHDHDPA